ncbi:MAG: response regulator [Candidatus Binatia bacterium]|nr:response regulator [Candidatus Binatia bacterium]
MDQARLLVVDDSLTIRRALEFILKPRGYALEFAADGREALDRAASFDPDLVLLDYVLPDMRGPDVCSALSAIPSTAQTPVILVSAKGASIRQAYQDAQNVVSYITKPFKPQVVLSIVDNALSRGRATVVAAEPAAPRPQPTRATMKPAPTPAGASLPLVRAATLEETFSALLGQLEDAVSAETSTDAAAPRTLARLGDPLRRAREQLREIGQHIEDDGVAPYRLRPDGTFANIASTLLETHRVLCEATLALAATGAPGPELPTPPEVIVLVPTDHELHTTLSQLAGPRKEVLLIDREFASVPWVVHLMQPQVLVGVPGADLSLNAAIGRLPNAPCRRLAIAPLSASLEGGPWAAFEHVADLDELAGSFQSTESRGGEPTRVIGLEVVSL